MAKDFPLTRGMLRVRDPFLVADADAGLYRLYAQTGNRTRRRKGVEVYSSPDLRRWSRPATVLALPAARRVQAVWAPEVHRWGGRWYLLATLTFRDRLAGPPPVASRDWPRLCRRGTHVFVSDSLLGPFAPLRDESLTPPEWMALDGTLHVERGRPWLVFCHEWVQVRDGEMAAMPLTRDLGAPAGRPKRLFRASEASGVSAAGRGGFVTDGPFLHRTRRGALLMLWSSFLPREGYSLLAARSAGGGIAGPWRGHRLVAGSDGGHGMLFRSFEGELLLALHRPNESPRERLHLFTVREAGNRLTIQPRR